MLCLQFSDSLMRDLTADVYYAVQVIHIICAQLHLIFEFSNVLQFPEFVDIFPVVPSLAMVPIQCPALRGGGVLPPGRVPLPLSKAQRSLPMPPGVSLHTVTTNGDCFFACLGTVLSRTASQIRYDVTGNAHGHSWADEARGDLSRAAALYRRRLVLWPALLEYPLTINRDAIFAVGNAGDPPLVLVWWHRQTDARPMGEGIHFDLVTAPDCWNMHGRRHPSTVIAWLARHLECCKISRMPSPAASRQSTSKWTSTSRWWTRSSS